MKLKKNTNETIYLENSGVRNTHQTEIRD